MSKPLSAEQLLHVKNYAELCRELEKEPGCVRIENGSGSCVKFYGPHGMVPVHNHPGQRPKFGTLRSMIRMAVAAGIVVGLFCLICLICLM